ncbi:hypothetical protein DFH08DRAFT_727614 [Mycena albidolilacea]|uniref:F-box domain-containing protein n=1 Tax=Mycena albidolilacea TaxID=1033008 RepID=A0AAD7F4X9_9AGAR|nr:hypothetical protein DFH08DRAFT_727614 [Mycena albidolilacea]
MSIAAALRAQISDLSSAISRQQELLDDMQTRLEHLQNQLDSIAYPVLTLPPEMTSEIFIHCLPAKRDIDVVNPEEAPLLLMHVCRAWRHIAISTPALWTAFDICQTAGLHCLAEIAQAWFERARKCPLSVSIYGSLSAHNAFDAFMKTFRQNSRQMASLELHMHVEDFRVVDLHLFEVFDFPLLQKLSVRVLIDEDSEEDPADVNAISMFYNAPLLHEVLISEALPSFVVLPWQQITKFTGELYSVEDCLEAISLMPNLLECTFSAFELENDDADELAVVSHPNMQYLALLTTTSILGKRASSVEVLTLIRLPALRTLEILDTDDFDEEELDAFLELSSPPLRKLTVRPLEGANSIQLQLSPPLVGLTSLIELEVWRPASVFVDVFFEFFGWDSSMFPQLLKLSFLGVAGLEEDMSYEADVYEILCNAAEPIAKRRDTVAGCAQLQSFRVVSRGTFDLRFPPEDLLPFSVLKESGMDVYIGTERRSIV